MGVLVANPITAAREVAPRDGLAGAVGLGVIVPDADPLDPDGRWPLGYRLWGPSCGSVQIGSLGVCALPPGYIGQPNPQYVDATRWQGGPASAPFRIWSGVTCTMSELSADGVLTAWQAEAERLLDLSAWAQIGHELWTGEQAQLDAADNRHLASLDSTVLGEGLGIVEAIARIEDALGATVAGDVAVIHVPRRLVPYLAHAGLISSVTGQTARIFTHNGSLVVADRGYPGTGPGGQPPDSTGAWIYGTGVLSARVDARAKFPAVGPEQGDGIASAAEVYTNDAIVRAEKRAAISWMCGHFAAHLTYC